MFFILLIGDYRIQVFKAEEQYNCLQKGFERFLCLLGKRQTAKRHDENGNTSWEVTLTVYMKDNQVPDQENNKALIIVLIIYLIGPKHPAFLTYWGFSK